MKQECIKCKISMPLSDFYKHSGMASGVLGKCRTCCRVDASENRNGNLDRVRAYDRGRGSRRSAEGQREYRKRNPEKVSAQNAVRRAKERGLIYQKPCIICGSRNSVAHHDDYSKKLDVTWLCQLHHVHAHRELNLIPEPVI